MTFPERPADAFDALAEECEQVSKTVLSLSEDDFARPTRCTAWNVKELLGHMWRDIDRINFAIEHPADEVDADAVSYWTRYDPVGDAPDVAARGKETADRFATGSELAQDWDRHWRDTIDRARLLPPDRIVVTWGPKLTLVELVKTRVLEITVHRLDLDDALGHKGWGTDQAVAIVDEILVGLLGQDPPPELEWDAIEFIEKGTGRQPLTDEEREALEELADRFPLLA